MSRSGSATHRSRPSNAQKKIPLTRLYVMYGGICYICKRHILFEEATRDHYLPAVLGGPYEWHNIRLACISCNINRTKDLGKICAIKRTICLRCRATITGRSVLRCYGKPLPIKARDLELLLPQIKAYRNRKSDHICKISKSVQYRIGRNGSGNHDMTTDIVELGYRVVGHLKKENAPMNSVIEGLLRS